MLFDLDDTLLDRSKAVEKLFLIVLERCYGEVNHSAKIEMLQTFKECDKRSYGNRDACGRHYAPALVARMEYSQQH